MSFLSYIRSREYGDKEHDIFPLGSIINRFQCRRGDQHHIEAQEFGECTTPLACRFSDLSPQILAIADEDGGILILNTNLEGIQAIQQDWLAHKNAVFDIDWMPTENKLLSASGDQTVTLWDVETEEKINLFRGHKSSVKTARFCRDSKDVFATGARDGNVMVFDNRVKKKDGYTPAVNVIKSAHKSTSMGSTHKKKKSIQQDSPQSVTAVIFQDEHTIITSGSVDGSIKMWDLRKNYTVLKTAPLPKHTFHYCGSSIRTHGFSCLTLDSSGSSLFASCMDNIIYQYDTAACSKTPVAYYRGHKNSTFYVKTVLSPDESFLMSGSSDGSAYVWQVSEPRAQPWILQGHGGEVSAVEWCHSDISKVVTVSDDSTIRIWRLGSCEEKNQPYGDVVGRVQRNQHKSISVNSTELDGLDKIPNTKVKMTPKKGNVVPKSPVKMSLAMKDSIKSLSKSVLLPTPENPDKKMPSPSIQSWLSGGRKLNTQLNSPLKKTPRKLLITPKKQDGDTSEKLGESNRGQSLGSCSVKRKLYGMSNTSPELQKSKKQKTVGEEYFCGHVQDENSCDGVSVQHKISPNGHEKKFGLQVTSGHNRHGEPLKCNENNTKTSDDIKTPVKKSSKTAEYNSPTVNLPNYVFNPVPRTPVAKTPERGSVTPKTPNWLAQIRAQRTMSASKASADLEVTPKGQSLNTSEIRSSKTTPRRKKVDFKRRGSIAQYFSPKGPEKEQTDSKNS